MARRNPPKIIAVGSLPNRDPHRLLRLVRAQNSPAGPGFFSIHDTALRGMLSDGKTQADDWIGCVRPGLQSRGGKRCRVSLGSMDEARAFMELPALGNRLLGIGEALLLSRAECPGTEDRARPRCHAAPAACPSPVARGKKEKARGRGRRRRGVHETSLTRQRAWIDRVMDPYALGTDKDGSS